MKLPVAVAFYKLTEIEPDILSRGTIYSPDKDSLNNLEYFRPAEELVPGQVYSIKQLIHQMIVNSDNDVVPSLVNILDPAFYNKTFVDLAVNIPSKDFGGIHSDFVSAKTYGAILRVLYNSSYLKTEQSDDLLNIMSQSKFFEGLRKGVPGETAIAHKFGEAIAVNASTRKVSKIELHDCGIVYHPDSPYILCVMTEGGDFKNLTKIIGDISASVWEEQ
jgi:hypothetical protein